LSTLPPISSNVCTRCGKPRVNGKSWTEKITNYSGTSTVTHTQTICPDPNCQKLVEEKLAFEKAKSDKIKADFDQRAADKKILRAQISFAKKKK
jgi:hypothetical protein